MDDFVNEHNHPRGTICVLREVNGRMVALALCEQWFYRGWNGCFSLL